MCEVYLRLRVDSRQEGEWEESKLQEWERWNTEEGKGECNQERRRVGMETRDKLVRGWGGGQHVGEAYV